MKTVTSAFTDAWKAKFNAGQCFVYYKRRYWNGSAYVYEANWTQVTMREYAQVGRITWALDTPLLNTVKVSNVVIRLKNTDWRWVQENAYGVFGADATATSGYVDDLMQFQVRFGYKLADGTWELVNLFTGVLSDLIHDTERMWSEATVSGMEWLLQLTDAQTVGTAFTDSGLTGAVDGSNKIFTTTQKGVSQARFVVKKSGTTLTQGTDYTVSGFSVSGGVVTVTMATAPASGSTMTASGYTWYTLKGIGDLLTDLANAAGVTIGSIAAVNFPGTGTGSTTLGTFIGTSYTDSWTLVYGVNGPSGTIAVAGSTGSVVTVTGTGDGGYASLVTAGPGAGHGTGVFSWYMDDRFDNYEVHFMHSVATATSGVPNGDGYFVRVLLDTVSLCRMDSGTATVLASYSKSNLFNDTIGGGHSWTVTRSAAGLMSVFVDGVQLVTATDTTYTSAAYFWYVTGEGGTLSASGHDAISAITWSNAITLTMADFTGMTCYDAVQLLVKLPDYEWGFDSDGAMFVRPKTVSSVTDYTLSDNDGITKLTDFRGGEDLIINVSQVTYGNYYSQYDSSSLPETAPTSQDRFKSRIQQESWSLLLADDSPIAAGRAQILHDNHYRAQRRCKMTSKIIPQADLSDVVGVTFFARYLKRNNVFGDPLQTWGESPFGDGRTDYLCKDMPAKIIGMSIDPNSATAEYEVQEVLA